MTYSELCQIETVTEAAMVAYLATQNIKAYPARSDEDIETPFVGVSCSGVTAVDRATTTTFGKDIFYLWSGSLNIAIVTMRERNSTDHATLVGKVRAALSSGSVLGDTELNAHTTHHRFTEFIPRPSTQGIDDAKTQDITELSFNFVVGFTQAAVADLTGL